jgi:hypothetical protein
MQAAALFVHYYILHTTHYKRSKVKNKASLRKPKLACVSLAYAIEFNWKVNPCPVYPPVVKLL